MADNSGSATSTGGAGRNGSVKGRTTIADSVVATIAGIAARETPGVHAMGGGMSRALGAVRNKVSSGGDDPARGVKVEVGEKQAAADLDVVVEYGESISDVAEQIRSNVARAIQQMTALEVVEINISVGDVHIEGEDDDEDEGQSASRVQ
ncbi:Asp23/Gls24 family envelope stress response protein [Streptomyces sp. NPDC058374]|uniref:Asp23/Gls24 family envelope stress response protein n=1 Tax=unclassified Streptomyces TaxID=2593676 RepID=UPI003659929E